MKRMSPTEYHKRAYCHGAACKESGYERKSFYSGMVGEKYWLAGYDGIKITNFSTWHKSLKTTKVK